MFGYSPPRPRETATHVRDARPGPPVLTAVPSLELCSPADWDGDADGNLLLGEIDLASTPAAVRPARTYVRELVGYHFATGPSGLGDLQLLTSEAVTNSVLHARPLRDGTITLAVLRAGDRVRVEVIDAGPLGPCRPCPRTPSPSAAGGCT